MTEQIRSVCKMVETLGTLSKDEILALVLNLPCMRGQEKNNFTIRNKLVATAYISKEMLYLDPLMALEILTDEIENHLLDAIRAKRELIKTLKAHRRPSLVPNVQK